MNLSVTSSLAFKNIYNYKHWNVDSLDIIRVVVQEILPYLMSFFLFFKLSTRFPYSRN